MKVTRSTLAQATNRHVWTRAFAVAALGLLPVSGCDCGPDLIVQRAELITDACKAPAAASGEEFKGGYEDCGVDFGDASLSEKVERTITITNDSAIQLDIRSFKLVGDPAFKLVNEPPAILAAGISTQVKIEIRPTLESAIVGEIQIVSNAGNITERVDADDPDNTDTILRIPVTLNGVDNGLPDIEIIPNANCGSPDPLGVDFGRVATGGIGICQVEVKNNGARDLFFDGLAFFDVDDNGVIHEEPEDSAEAAAIAITGTPPDNETPLGAGQQFTLRLAFSPDALGRFSTWLRFTTSDPDEGVIDMPVIGNGVIGPTCVAEIASVNGVTTPPFNNIDILDDVVVTTANSTTPTPDGAVVSTTWTIKSAGPGSTAVLTDPSSEETGLAFANRRGLDVAGRYELCAEVTDDLGTKSTNNCCVAFEAIPSQAFLVQATWIDPDSDMDMHVSRKSDDGYCVNGLNGGEGTTVPPFAEAPSFDEPESDRCADVARNDCNYLNCKALNFDDTPNPTGPEWDGVAGRTAGDPFLDIDDTTGFGPENTNIDEVAPGSYGFGVETYRNPDGDAPAVVTMRLFIFGRLVGVWQEEILSEFWQVGIVHFTTPTEYCIEDLTDGDPQNDCPGL